MTALSVIPLGKFSNLHLRCELLLFVIPLGLKPRTFRTGI